MTNNFNSIKVRLKRYHTEEDIHLIHQFQFHKGTIKTDESAAYFVEKDISIP